MPELPSGTVTFLFTDIERSTESAAALGDERWAEALETHRDLLRPSFEQHGGVEVGTEGDAFFVAFARAGEAVNAAVDGQRALESHPWPGEARLRIRMGLHTGEALVRGGDYVGHDVHKAKRVSDAAHGGQILLSQTTADLVRDTAALVDLGPHRLKDLAEPQRIFQVGDEGFPPLRSLEAFRHNLPTQRSAFIGRERQIAQIQALLLTHQLVTLTGVGGAGKTRLALQVGAEVLDGYPDGVFFVDLAPISDPSAIVPAVAAAVGVPIGGEPGTGAAAAGPPDELLLAFLASRRALLILDNCEHLLDACADLADRVLGRCPDVSMLATSREGLAVEGEQIWQIPSLSIPKDANDAAASEAVSLFKTRAQAARPDFDLTPTNVAAVTGICRRLDGLPLAIEFAAARVSHLPPQEIADRLGDMFRLLTGGRRRVQRQQTLQAALDWSYDLLDERERVLLRRLAVFAGSFTIPAVEGICAADDLDKASILDLLGSLVAKSLVLTEEQRGKARYRLIETVRLYASEKLREAGESDRFRACHRDWFLEWVSSFTWEQAFFEVLVTGLAVAEELANLRASLEWSQAEGDLALVVRMANRMRGVWGPLGNIEEGYRWLSVARPEELDLTAEDQVAALATASFLANLLQDTAAADLSERSLRAGGGTSSVPLISAKGERATTLAVLAEWASDPRLADEARRETDEMLSMAGSFGALAEASACGVRTTVEFVLGDSRAAAESAERALTFRPRNGVFRTMLAAALHMVGEHERARELIIRSLDDAQDDPTPSQEWVDIVVVPATVMAGAGDTEGARALLAERVDTARRIGRPGAVEVIVLGFAAVSFLSGDVERASRLLGWIRARTFDEQKILPSPSGYALYQHYVRAVRSSIDPDVGRQCLAEGRAMSEDEAVAHALEGTDA